MAEIFVGPWAQHDEPDVRDIEEFCGVRATRFGTRHGPNELPRQAAGVLMPLIVARAGLKVITDDGRFMARANVERAGRLHEMQLELSPSVILALAALGVSVPDSDEIYLFTFDAAIQRAIQNAARRYFESVTGFSADEPALLVTDSKVHRIRGISDATVWRGRFEIQPETEELLSKTGSFGVKGPGGSATSMTADREAWLLPTTQFRTKDELIELYQAVKTKSKRD